MKQVLLAALLIAACSLTAPAAKAASPSPAPSPAATGTPATTVDETMARAKEWLHRLQTGDIDHGQLDAKMNALLTADMAKKIAAQFGPLGDPTAFPYVGQQEYAPGAMSYIYRVVFKSTVLNEVFSIDATGKISGIQFPPA